MPALDSARLGQGRKVLAEEEMERSHSDQQTHLDLARWERDKRQKHKLELLKITPTQTSAREPGLLPSMQFHFGSFQWI